MNAELADLELSYKQAFTDAAYEYVARGWRVLPLKPGGNKPLYATGFEHGCNSATSDAEAIVGILRSHPRANLGIATGVVSGLIVIDIDHHSEDKNGFVWYDRTCDRLPETLMAQSPSGGRHLYFSYLSAGIKSGADVLAPGVDVRADGGFIAVAPSARADGQYIWLNSAPIAPLPDWLLSELLAPKTPALQSDATSTGLTVVSSDTSRDGEYWLERYLAEVEVGATRNESGLKLACQLRDEGLTLEQAKPLMLAYAARVPEGDHPYTEREALASLAQAYARPPREPALASARAITPARQDWPEPPSAAAFYGLAGDIVAAIEPHTEADRVALLVDFLTRFGCAAYVAQKPDEVGIPGPHLLIGATPHLPRLYVGICGPTGEGRKGESAAPDKILFAEAEKIAKRAYGCDTPDGESKPLVNVTSLDGLASGEGLIFALRDPGQMKPAKGESSLGDAGVEDKRLLVMEPEFANLLSTMSRQGNTISPLLRTAWDGIPTLQIATKNNPMKATGTHVCIIGHITKPELLKRLSETEGVNGFANRFLWVAVRRSKCLPFPEPFAPESDEVQRLAPRLYDAVNTAKRIGRVELADDAKHLWADVYPRLSSSRGESMFSALVARGAPIVMRLALIYALTDGSSLIGEPHLRAALALWEYSERTVKYIWGDASGDEVADNILRALRQADSLSRSDISAQLGRNVQASRISVALNSLAERELAISETQKTKGRSVEMWRAR